jgi:hypothetical protein
MPRGRFADELLRLLTPLTVGLLLPLFFVYSGLNTRIGLVNSWPLAVWLPAYWSPPVSARRCRAGLRHDSTASRPIRPWPRRADERARPHRTDHPDDRYERGIITQTLFSIMVMMALITTSWRRPCSSSSTDGEVASQAS